MDHAKLTSLDDVEIDFFDGAEQSFLAFYSTPAALADPYSAAAITKLLFEGAVTWLGGEIVAQIFGGDDPVDIEDLMKRLILNIQRTVRLEIAREALARAEARLATLQRRMNHYTNTPTDDRLISATEASEELFDELKRLGLAAQSSFSIQTFLYILVLQERERRFRLSEALNVKDVARDAIAYLLKSNDNLLRLIDGAIKLEVKHNRISLPCPPGADFRNKCYTDDHYYYEIRNTRTGEKLWSANRTNRTISHSRLDSLVTSFKEEYSNKLHQLYIDPAKRNIERLHRIIAEADQRPSVSSS